MVGSPPGGRPIETCVAEQPGAKHERGTGPPGEGGRVIDLERQRGSHMAFKLDQLDKYQAQIVIKIDPLWPKNPLGWGRRVCVQSGTRGITTEIQTLNGSSRSVVEKWEHCLGD